MPLRQRTFVVLCASYLATHSWAIAQGNEQSETMKLEIKLRKKRKDAKTSISVKD